MRLTDSQAAELAELARARLPRGTVRVRFEADDLGPVHVLELRAVALRTGECDAISDALVDRCWDRDWPCAFAVVPAPEWEQPKSGAPARGRPRRRGKTTSDRR